MLIKLLTGQPDYEKALRYRRLACLALLAVGLVGLACYALLVPRSGLGDYAQGFYLGAACGITGGALVLLLRTRYLQTHPAARRQAKIRETDEREVHLVHTAFRWAGIATFYAAAGALFIVLPLNRDAFTALLAVVLFYAAACAAIGAVLARRG